nr:hypothetical protein [Rhizobium altiplani]
MRSGHADAAEILIKRGADVNKESALGLPLTAAVLTASQRRRARNCPASDGKRSLAISKDRWHPRPEGLLLAGMR